MDYESHIPTSFLTMPIKDIKKQVTEEWKSYRGDIDYEENIKKLAENAKKKLTPEELEALKEEWA